MFENEVLRRIFEYKREEVSEGWCIFHNQELHKMFVSARPNIVTAVEYNKMELMENVAGA
jgi:hypothetical protein